MFSNMRRNVVKDINDVLLYITMIISRFKKNYHNNS